MLVYCRLPQSRQLPCDMSGLHAQMCARHAHVYMRMIHTVIQAINLTSRAVLQEPVEPDDDGTSGTPPTAFMYGLFAGSSSLTGFDAAAHMCEETQNVVTAARWSFLLATSVSGLSGLLYLGALCCSAKVGSSNPPSVPATMALREHPYACACPGMPIKES